MLSSIATTALRRTTTATFTSAVATTRQHFRPALAIRFFSEDSHGDFAPQRKVVEGEDAAMKMIQEHVESNPVMLYMKGNPSMPMCGFSATVVQALKAEGIDFSSVNVLDYPDIREGVKKFSEWPTIPQLYVDGEFIGGCDIIVQMHESGELADLLKDVAKSEE
ncbi:unnamed protein product [Cylindrotheca closterium]|uniref:Glutaredoxin domain-containing protein n=1 Tax=Cylindrotheca closterium TaxID=2856 RepID=A0AAD2GBX8_9STRA|nr:unnamed protein product [Cylindrotheca closterium]